MNNIILLFFCLLSGFLLRKTPYFNEEAPNVLNRLLIYFFIPLIAIYQVPKIDFQPSLIWLTLTPFLIFGCSFLFFQLSSRLFSLDTATKTVLILCSGISSTSFVGFPVFEILYGSEGLAYGILLSLGGTILVFNTLGIYTLFYYSSGKTSIWNNLKKIFSFPPFIAFVIGLTINFMNLRFPPWAESVLGRIVSPFSVVALLSIGMQIDFRISGSMLKEMALGQFFKLIMAPLIVYILLWWVLEIRDTAAKVCIVGAAIGSMNAMSILTAEKGLHPKLAILMPAIGIPLSIPLLFIIDYFLV